MFRSIENSPRYDSFVELIEDVKRRYHKTHPEETEGLHYGFRAVTRDGRSGYIKVERLEPPRSIEALLVEDNRVVGYETEELEPSSWLEY